MGGMKRLDDPRLLERLAKPVARLQPRSALWLAFGCGGLAPWILRPEVLELARKETQSNQSASDWLALTPHLNQQAGDIGILIAQQGAEQLPLLADGLVIPVRWERGRGHGEELPAELHVLADEVLRAVVKASSEGQPETWGLQLGNCIAPPVDLSGLCVSWDSAWAPLLGGLLAAIHDVRPDPGVWATGAWKSDAGIVAVDHIRAKLEAAWRFGAKVLAVPEAVVEEAQRVVADLEIRTPRADGSTIKIVELKQGEPDPRKALRKYMDELELPPGQDEPVERRSAYYLRREATEQSRRYYVENLLPELIRCYRRQVEGEQAWPSHLVEIISNASPELVPIAVGAFQPQRLDLLYTEDMREHLKMTRRNLEAGGLSCAIEEVYMPEKDSLMHTPPCPVQSARCSQSRLLDVTGGTKLMSLALAAPPITGKDDVLIYWDHDPRNGRALPGSQRLYYRRGKEGWKRLGEALVNTPSKVVIAGASPA